MRTVALFLQLVFIGGYHAIIIRRSVRRVLKDNHALHRIDRWIYYGATYLDPKLLVIWFLVKTNADLEDAKQKGVESQLQTATRKSLAEHGYALAALDHIHVGLDSTENVDGAGGWQRYFQ